MQTVGSLAVLIVRVGGDRVGCADGPSGLIPPGSQRHPSALTRGSAPCAAAAAEPRLTGLGVRRCQTRSAQAGGPTVKPTGMRCSSVRAHYG